MIKTSKLQKYAFENKSLWNLKLLLACLYKILEKFNCFVNFRSMTKRFTQQTARKEIPKELRRS